MLGRWSRRADRRAGRPVRAAVEPVAGRYARILDGETLWLAVEGGPPTVTLRYGGGELVEPTEPETGAGPAGLVRARVPLGALADVTQPTGAALVVEVLAGDGRQAAPITWTEEQPPGPVRASIPTRDRRWRWRVTAPDGRLALVRDEADPGHPVARVTVHDDGRGAHLALATPGAAVEVRAEEHDLAPGEQAAVTHDGLPLVRARDDLRRPNHAVALPTLGDGLRLRWRPDGHLVVAREPARQPAREPIRETGAER